MPMGFDHLLSPALSGSFRAIFALRSFSENVCLLNEIQLDVGGSKAHVWAGATSHVVGISPVPLPSPDRGNERW